MNNGQFMALLNELKAINKELRLLRYERQGTIDPAALEAIKGVGPATAKEIIKVINGSDVPQ